MKEEKPNRWLMVVAALSIQVCLGVIYAWGPIKVVLRDMGGPWTDTAAAMPFSVGLATLAAVMVFAGKWQDKVGPRKVATVGGILYGIGYLLASVVEPTPLNLTVTYGLISGAGIGFAYVCPIAALVKWFPDMKGTISGVAVAGFGAGAFVFGKIIPILAAKGGIAYVFQTLGIVFFIGVVLGAQILRNPPDGYKPEGWEPPKPSDNSKHHSGHDFEYKEIITTTSFWLLWAMLLIGSMAGLMTIGHIASFAKKTFVSQGVTAAEAAGMAATIVGVLSILNGLGRIAWGSISDKIGRTKALFAMFLLQGVAMFALSKFAASYYVIMAFAALVGFNFGGNFALFPSATADFFGTKNIGINYGLVFTSYGVAGLLGPVLGGKVFDATQSYSQAFIIAGGLCIFASVLAFITKAPIKKVEDEAVVVASTAIKF